MNERERKKLARAVEKLISAASRLRQMELASSKMMRRYGCVSEAQERRESTASGRYELAVEAIRDLLRPTEGA